LRCGLFLADTVLTGNTLHFGHFLVGERYLFFLGHTMALTAMPLVGGKANQKLIKAIAPSADISAQQSIGKPLAFLNPAHDVAAVVHARNLGQ
jgi:hypothetical protein